MGVCCLSWVGRREWGFFGIGFPFFGAASLKKWADEQKYFRAFPDILDLIYTNVVLPTAVNKKGKREAKEYDWHKDSIRKIVESIGCCEQSAST